MCFNMFRKWDRFALTSFFFTLSYTQTYRLTNRVSISLNRKLYFLFLLKKKQRFMIPINTKLLFFVHVVSTAVSTEKSTSVVLKVYWKFCRRNLWSTLGYALSSQFQNFTSYFNQCYTYGFTIIKVFGFKSWHIPL